MVVRLAKRENVASDHPLFVVPLHLVMPLFCVTLGFWVAALRPREKMAWILLALLLGISQLISISPENMDGRPLSNLALGYKLICGSTGFIWLLLLGLYFPEQLAFERRHPWLKWLLIVPLAAALMMASLQASLRGQTMMGPENMAALVGRVNQLVYEVSSPERYPTFFFACYDAQSSLLTYVNAGHNPPMVLNKCSEDWKLRRLEVGGTVVGLLPHFSYSQDQVQLKPGDVLVAFTDCISEAMNSADGEWGEEKMLETLKTCDGKSSAETVACIMAAADRFTAGAKQYDDMTVVVMKVTPDGIGNDGNTR